MSTTDSLDYADSYTDQYEPYRILSRSAVLSLVFGVASLLALIFPPMVIVPLVGAILGLSALLSIRRYPNELTGAKLAVAGLVLCVSLLVGGVARHTYVYATEVPEGYQRVSFYQLQPDKKLPMVPVSPTAIELNGRQVFIKGYVHPGVKRRGPVNQFVLVPDMGTCCFGGQPKLTDMILVTLREPNWIEYSRQKRNLGGVLVVDIQLKPITGLKGVYYQLDADYVK